MVNTPDAVARQWFKEVWDEGREEAIDRLADADMIVHGLERLHAPPRRGTAAFKTVFHTFREALGDPEIAVERTVTEGDTCVVTEGERAARRSRARRQAY